MFNAMILCLCEGFSDRARTMITTPEVTSQRSPAAPMTTSTTTGEDDQSQWMIEWNMWRKGTLDDKSPSTTSSSVAAIDRSSVSPCPPSMIGISPSTTRASTDQAADTTTPDSGRGGVTGAVGGSKLDVWRNLARGLGKTLNNAEQNLGSVLSQAAVRLLNRRTSSADEVINMKSTNASLSSMGVPGDEFNGVPNAATGGSTSINRSPYGIPAKCADSFTRTNYRTASRRRRDFRSRRLNPDDDDEMAGGACYRDSV